MAQALIARGVAWRGRRDRRVAHAITKWLGRDSEDFVPVVGSLDVTGSGWLLACSDGLWNYASAPSAIRDQIQAATATDPEGIALELVAFANAAGGHDNITAALARVGPSAAPPPPPPATEAAAPAAPAVAPAAPAVPPPPPPVQNAGTRRADSAGSTDCTHHRRSRRGSPDRWLSSPPPSSRTSSCRTAGPTSTRSSPSTCKGAGTAGQSGVGRGGRDHHRRHVRLDGPRDDGAAKDAAQAALAEIVDGTKFAVIAGADRAMLVYPQVPAGPAWCGWTPCPAGGLGRDRPLRRQRRHGDQHLARPGRPVFASVPEVTQRHALLLTDGENRERPGRLDEAINRATGYFQCDCRGAGTDWQVAEMRRIAQALLGTVDIIPRPEEMRAQFQEIMRARCRAASPTPSCGCGRRRARRCSSCARSRRRSRTSPTRRRRQPADRGLPDGRVGRRVPRLPRRGPGPGQGARPGAAAARVQLALGADVVTQGLVKATWSNNSELTTRIDQQVAHYTGQTELAAVIQEGLAAKAAGDEATATTKLGRAVQLAAETGNDEATSEAAARSSTSRARRKAPCG